MPDSSALETGPSRKPDVRGSARLASPHLSRSPLHADRTKRPIQELADTLFTVTGHKLQINDESLDLGGLFDISGQWTRPHCTHRDGRSADIRTNVALGIAREDSLLITRWWTQTFGAGTAQAEARPPHTHLKSP